MADPLSTYIEKEVMQAEQGGLEAELARGEAATHALAQHLYNMRSSYTSQEVTINGESFKITIEHLPLNQIPN